MPQTSRTLSPKPRSHKQNHKFGLRWPEFVEGRQAPARAEAANLGLGFRVKGLGFRGLRFRHEGLGVYCRGPKYSEYVAGEDFKLQFSHAKMLVQASTLGFRACSSGVRA